MHSFKLSLTVFFFTFTIHLSDTRQHPSPSLLLEILLELGLKDGGNITPLKNDVDCRAGGVGAT